MISGRAAWVAAVVGSAVVACGGGGDDTAADAGSDPAALCAEASASRPVYLAFEGVTLEAVADGKDDAASGSSSLVEAATAFPPFLAGRADREQVIAEVTGDIRQALAPLGARVTTERPAGEHLMLVFAGVDRGSLLGLSRQDCGHRVDGDVAILFEGVAAAERGRYSPANEALRSLSAAVGLAKSSGPGHPCSCDPDVCGNDTLCTLSPAAEVLFARCPDSGDVQDEVAAFSRGLGCTP